MRTRFVILYSVSPSLLHVTVEIVINYLNSLPGMERHKTVEPFVLPKQLLSLDFNMFTHWQASC